MLAPIGSTRVISDRAKAIHAHEGRGSANDNGMGPERMFFSNVLCCQPLLTAYLICVRLFLKAGLPVTYVPLRSVSGPAGKRSFRADMNSSSCSSAR